MWIRIDINWWEVFWRREIIRELPPKIYPSGAKHRIVLCICDCGNTKEIQRNSLRNWATTSCWCLHKEIVTIHWNRNHPLYNTRHAMLERCNKVFSTDYHNYGARWIKVCDRRLDIENFIEDMWERPEWMTLDRIDNDWDYCPENCKRSTHKQQSRNRRSNTVYLWKCLAEREEYFWMRNSSISSKISYWGSFFEVCWFIRTIETKKLRVPIKIYI